MSKEKVKIVVTDVIAKLPSTELVKFPSGGEVLQTTLSFISGRRARIGEGTSSYVNAQYMKPGDVVSFSIGTIKGSSFMVNKDQANERTIHIDDYVDVDGLEAIELGSFSEEPSEMLKASGREPVKIKERIIAPKQEVVAPAPEKDAPADKTDSPFGEEH